MLALLGHPVAHSRSPRIHTAALTALGLDASYLAFDVAPGELGAAIGGLRALGARGANVTVPHKEAVMAHLDAVEPAARAIGAVNTIVREGGRLVGANTDAPGLVRALADAGVDPRGARVLVVGAGGAARAAVVGLAEAGAARVTVAARRLAQAEALAASLALPLDTAALDAPPTREVDLLVQATSATMDEIAGEALARALSLESLPAHAAVFDLVYAPLETAVLRAARARGLVAVDGLGMLVWQAALAFERWLGVAPPIEVMRAAALRSS
ncbi:MAG: shikimate dehydrogenase [Sandaracinaceae bacterium]|nr:shikimate dehydrogenase [Sandaracinaceae bacterium]